MKPAGRCRAETGRTDTIKVLDLRDSPWVDGPGRTILEVAEGLRDRDVIVTIGGFVQDGGGLHAYLKEAQNRSLPYLPFRERGRIDTSLARQVFTAIDELEADVLHSHDFRTNLLALWCARRKKIPVLSTCHGWIANNRSGEIKSYLDKRLLRKFDHVVTVSDHMRQALIRTGFPENKLTTVVNALRTDEYEVDRGSTGFRRELGVSGDRTLIANIGRLSAEKGQALLLKAMSRLVENGESPHLVFVGVGPEEAGLRQLTERLHLDGHVSFAGFRKDMRNVYNGVDLVVQSSLTEGMPNVVLEAMLMETPVIATGVGGTAEIVTDGVTGKLVDPGSDAVIADAIQAFLDDAGAFYAMAKKGRQVIRSKFDHNTRLDRLHDLYLAAVNRT